MNPVQTKAISHDMRAICRVHYVVMDNVASGGSIEVDTSTVFSFSLPHSAFWPCLIKWSC